MEFQGFDKSLVRFLGQLKHNNNRAWFERNKARYEAEVREPGLSALNPSAWLAVLPVPPAKGGRLPRKGNKF